METQSKNFALRCDFEEFCNKHPELRFWQALRAWADVGFILTAESQDIVSDEWNKIKDTFYFEGKNE